MNDSDRMVLVAQTAVRAERYPLALKAICLLCGEMTESFNLHRFDPPPRHRNTCALYGYSTPPKGPEFDGEANAD